VLCLLWLYSLGTARGGGGAHGDGSAARQAAARGVATCGDPHEGATLATCCTCCAYSQLALIAPYSLLPTPYSLLPTPYSLLPTPYSLLPTPYSLLPTPYSLLPSPYSLLPTHYVQVLSHWEGELHAFVQAGVGARLEIVQMKGNARIFDDMKDLLARQKQAGELDAATLSDGGCSPM
jgi:hypothetical protein